MKSATMERLFGRVDLPAHLKSTKVKHMLGDYGLFIVFALVVIFLSLGTESFLSIDNLINVIRQSSIVGFLALGMTFVMITSGIDLSVGSIVGFSGVVAASLAPAAGNAFLIPLVGGMLVGVSVGLINSALIIWGTILPFLATLATMAAVRSAALIFTSGHPVSSLSASFDWLGAGMIGPVPVPVLLFGALALASDHLLARTRFGRHVYAVGGSEESARNVGIQVRWVKVKVYLIAAIFAAFGGIVLTARVDGADPLAGTGYELQAIAATVIGGTSIAGGMGKVRGTVLGVLLVGVVMNGLDLLNISSYYQQAIQGIILVLAVVLNRWKSD